MPTGLEPVNTTPSTPGCCHSASPMIAPWPEHEIEHARRHSRVAVHLVQLESGPRRVLGRLVDHGVAGHQRRGRHAGGQRQREIEWRDADEDAVRPQHVGVASRSGSSAPWRGRKPCRLLHLAAVVVDQIGRLSSASPIDSRRLLPTSRLMIAASSNFRSRIDRRGLAQERDASLPRHALPSVSAPPRPPSPPGPPRRRAAVRTCRARAGVDREHRVGEPLGRARHGTCRRCRAGSSCPPSPRTRASAVVEGAVERLHVDVGGGVGDLLLRRGGGHGTRQCGVRASVASSAVSKRVTSSSISSCR